MGIFDALTSAVAGLQAQSYALQNISGNIANSETTGYKEIDTTFADLVSEASADEQTADGVTASSVATNTVQGTIESTSVSTDMAINGDGFFVVAMPTGTADNTPVFSGVNDYTRAGDFELNSDGYLVNGSGYYLMGVPIDSSTGNPIGDTPEVLQFNDEFVPAQATTAITYAANLPSSPSSGTLDTADYEANPLAGAPTAAEITGTGATLEPDAAAVGTSSGVGLTSTTTLASLGLTTGDTFTIDDGTTTTTYTITSANTITADDGTNTTTYTGSGSQDTVNDLMTAIDGGATGSNATVTASLNSSGDLVLTGANDNVSITAGGTGASDLGFGSGNNSFDPTNLLTQGAVSQGQTLTITVGNGTAQTITFGTGSGEVSTLAGLQTAIQNLTGVTGTVDTSNGDITLTAQSPTDSITIGGTATAEEFGIQNATALPANGTVIANDSSTFNDQSIDGGSITAYDSEGNPVNVQFRWAETSTGSWQLFYETNSSATGTEAEWQNAGTTFTFNSSGELSPPISSVTIQNMTVNGDNLGNVALNFGSNGLTQFADSSSSSEAQVNTLQQNGYAAGTLQSIAVNDENEITGTFSNGQTIPLAQITLATFSGADSLEAINGDAYAATTDSGAPIYSGGGTVEGSSLESSNVDIATQFSDLIVAQQAYSANARVMTTADQMIQSLLQVIQ
jgi:flagellar hook protein FlgE